MKVDVEGTEGAVFGSGRRLLEAFRPDILCEVLLGRADGEGLDVLLEPARLRRYLVTDAAARRVRADRSGRTVPGLALLEALPGGAPSMGLPVTDVVRA